MAADYQYEALHGWNHIRLLELLPGSDSDPISVLLHDHSLADDRDFESISYVWGDPTVRKEINCGDGTLQVTVNLHDALSHFRYSDRSRLLWSDAACINQQDLDERASQVRLMHLIYKNAAHCLVWLGPSDADSIVAASIIADMAAAAARILQVEPDQLDAQLERDGREISLATTIGFEGLPPRDSPSWAALMRFFTRKWFSRIWVVQEVSFARSVRFHCGADCMSWAALYHAADWIMCNSSGVDWHAIVAGLPPGQRDPFGLLSPRASNLMTMRGGDLETADTGVDELLAKSKRFDATDPRDKVFAMMNFAAFRRGIPDMMADYRASVASVYTNTTVEVIKGLKSLRIWTSVDHDPADAEPEFPSWVPRWHRPDTAASISGVVSKSNRASAGEPVPLDQMKLLLGPVLQLPGLVVDEVVDVCDMRQPLITETFHVFHPHEPWAPYPFHDPEDPNSRPVDAGAAPYQTKPEIIDAYATVLTAGLRESEGVFALPCTGRPNLVAANRVEFVAWLTELRGTQAGHPEYAPPGLYSPTQPDFGDAHADEVPGWAKHWRKMIRVYTVGQRLFRTRRGYLGMGTNGVMPGDLVCVMLGGDVPFVLRRTVQEGDEVGGVAAAEERYRLVGSGYVHGIMEGQVVEEWKEGKREYRTFDLV